MAEVVSDQLKFINVRALWLRALLLIVVAVAATTAAWRVARWCIGNTMSEYAPDVQTAQAAARLAPDDPQVHFIVGALNKQSFLANDLPEALRHYEEAVSLSPNDYRLWIELGQMREQTGDRAGAEQALRRAVELAPHYSLPQWLLGNLLLRMDRTDDAFAELRRAGDADVNLREQVFNLAWDVYRADVREIRKQVGDSAEVRAQLSSYFLKRGLLDDAQRLWESLSANEKKEQRGAGEALMNALLGAKRYTAALNVYHDFGAENSNVAIGQFTDGSFESDLKPAGAGGPFDWQIVSAPQSQIVVDARTRHSGARSLHMIFSATLQTNFRVAQLVVVEPEARYHFEGYTRAQNLKSVSTPTIEIVEAGNESHVLAASAPLAVGSGDWQQVALDFSVPPRTDGVVVRVGRAPCGAAVCPIFGKVWYDDFSFKRTGGGSAGPKRGSESAGANRNAAASGAR